MATEDQTATCANRRVVRQQEMTRAYDNSGKASRQRVRMIMNTLEFARKLVTLIRH